MDLTRTIDYFDKYDNDDHQQDTQNRRQINVDKDC